MAEEHKEYEAKKVGEFTVHAQNHQGCQILLQSHLIQIGSRLIQRVIQMRIQTDMASKKQIQTVIQKQYMYKN